MRAAALYDIHGNLPALEAVVCPTISAQEVTMRSTALAVVAALAVSVVGVIAQDALPQGMQEAKPVSIHLKNAPVSDLFKLLGSISGVEIRTQGTDRPVTVNFTDARVVDVFNFLVNAGHWTYSVMDEKTIIVTVTAER